MVMPLGRSVKLRSGVMVEAQIKGNTVFYLRELPPTANDTTTPR